MKYDLFTNNFAIYSGYDTALAKFTLKKFLLLATFLDAAKKERLIDFNPCLFCCQSDIKVGAIATRVHSKAFDFVKFTK